MAHQIAKLLLEHADTFLKRTEAIETAMSLGMPLHEMEEYLDWVDTVKSQPDQKSALKGPHTPQRRRPRVE